MPNPRRQDRELDALYAQLPRLECQGYCYDSCGPIDMSVRERARITERARKPIECKNGQLCSMLTEDRRCAVYEVRPMICRLWGLVRQMRCPYGCEPERWMSNHEAVRFLLDADRIGGPPEGDRKHRLYEQMFASLTEEELVGWFQQVATVGGRLPTLHRMGIRAPFEIPGRPVGRTGMAYPKPESQDE